MASPSAEQSLTATADRPRRARPILKWAGGKRQLLPELRRFVPTDFNGYHEPFVGSGALFFDLWSRRLLDGRPTRLIDTNVDLVGCYRATVRDVGAVIDVLERLSTGHAESPTEHYYRVRDEVFNPARRALGAGASPVTYPAELAGTFIYLNRTGFNGLYRLNARGGFNVPAGRYVRPRICDAASLRAAAAALGAPGVRLDHGGYEQVLESAAPGDLVYFDPPYAPLSATARFTSYTAAGFSEADQRRLREVALELADRGCSVILSNSTAPIIAELYESDSRARRAGFRAHQVPARRAINSDPSARGDVMEFIITNIQPTNQPTKPTLNPEP